MRLTLCHNFGPHILPLLGVPIDDHDLRCYAGCYLKPLVVNILAESVGFLPLLPGFYYLIIKFFGSCSNFFKSGKLETRIPWFR